MNEDKRIYDAVVIGGGPAGSSATIYIARANKEVRIISERNSALLKAGKIYNYYGFPRGIDGKELFVNGFAQACTYSGNIDTSEVVNILIKDDLFYVETLRNSYKSKTVVLATGSPKKTIDIKGIKELEGKGISYCAICDGFFFKDKKVGVLGSGDYAIAEANNLKSICREVVILSNGEHVNNDRGYQVYETKVKEIVGEDKVEEVLFVDYTSLKLDGIFVAYGEANAVDFAKKMGIEMNGNDIKVNEKMETNIKGLYACGDAIGGLRQVSKAVSDGAIAGLEVVKYLNKMEK